MIEILYVSFMLDRIGKGMQSFSLDGNRQGYD
jgi:hypothetical protein